MSTKVADGSKSRWVYTCTRELKILSDTHDSNRSSKEKTPSTSQHSSKSGGKHSSTSKSKQNSKSASNSSKHDSLSNSKGKSTNTETYTPSEPLNYYIEDPAHSTTGHSSTYTNAVAYIHGFPSDPAEQISWEEERRREAHADAQGYVDNFDEQSGDRREE
jgi:hypothetical protein